MTRLFVDFGTTNTVICHQRDTQDLLVNFLDNEGSFTERYPTLIAVSQDQLLFGLDAAAKINHEEWTVHRDLKRHLSNPSIDLSIQIGTGSWPLADLLLGFFETLMNDLKTRSSLTDSERNQPFLIDCSIPASVHSTWRFLTVEAARKAGFSVHQMLSEPNAAALDYAKRCSNDGDVIVLDLGGGTYDLSWVTHDENGLPEVKRSAGRWGLGGADFDMVLTELCMDLSLRSMISAASEVRLMEACKLAKQTIHPNTRSIRVEVGACLTENERVLLGIEEDESRVIKVNDYYKALTPLLEALIEPISILCQNNKLPQKVRSLYLVGGASALPIISRTLREQYGRKVRRAETPHGSVAFGLSSYDRQVRVNQNSSKSRFFGLFRDWSGGKEISFDPIFSPTDGDLQSKRAVHRRYRAQHDVGCLRFLSCDTLVDGNPEGGIYLWPALNFPYAATLQQQSMEELTQQKPNRQSSMGDLIEEQYVMDHLGEIDLRIIDLDTGYQSQTQLRHSSPTA